MVTRFSSCQIDSFISLSGILTDCERVNICFVLLTSLVQIF